MSKARAAAAPILALYKDILRVHREKLTGPLAQLGNDYVKSEFKAHLRGKTTKPQWQQFVQQWGDYKAFIGGTADGKLPMVDTSGELSEQVREAMSPDQLTRMEQLREEARRVMSGEEEPTPPK